MTCWVSSWNRIQKKLIKKMEIKIWEWVLKMSLKSVSFLTLPGLKQPLVWTIVHLCQFQEWQNLARDNVLGVFGHSEPNFEGLNQLKIVTMILQEVLRLCPACTCHGSRPDTDSETRKLDHTGRRTFDAADCGTPPRSQDLGR